MAVADALRTATQHVREGEPADAIEGRQPSWVVTPRSAREAAAVMAAAAVHELVVVARGNGTKMTWGLPPERVDVVVETIALNRVVDHVAGDLVVVAEAGLTLRGLQDRLAGADQHLSVDETVPGSTLGGIVATASSGPRRMGTGGVRDLLIGITVVRADGVMAKAGGKVVKNVAGFDLGKLMVGSYGTLGLITQLAFRLHHRPHAARWVVLPAADADMRDAIAAVVHSQAAPVALEVDQPAAGGAHVAVLVEGVAEGIDSRAADVAALLGPCAYVLTDTPWQTNTPSHDDDVTLKLTCRLSRVHDILQAARNHGVAVRGSAGVGVFLGSFPAAVGPRRAASTVDAVRAVCTEAGGSLVVVDAPADLKSELDVWGPVGSMSLMRRVKEQFDPQRRLAPGRFVGGI
jgi:glycolate oxidase FAD binding subunit